MCKPNRENESLLTLDYLKQLLHYTPETGVFTWRETRNGKVKVGQEAGYLNSPVPHRRVEINGKSYGAHRLAWYYVHGYFPLGVIDHIDGNPNNNILTNLRECSQAENIRNTRKSKNNATGETGVYWHSRDKVWHASAGFNDRLQHLGYFINKEDALAARKKFEIDNFGEFSYDKSQEIAESVL